MIYLDGVGEFGDGRRLRREFFPPCFEILFPFDLIVDLVDRGLAAPEFLQDRFRAFSMIFFVFQIVSWETLAISGNLFLGVDRFDRLCGILTLFPPPAFFRQFSPVS